MMVRFKLWLSLSLVYGLFPLAAFASDCSVDPDECTLKKLCEAATALNGDNTIWSTESSSAKHVTVAQTLGMECGVTPIVDLCETDPSECKLSQICEKATTESAGQISWDISAAGHVALAKEYGLQCDVSEEAFAQQIADDNQQTCSLSAPEACTDIKLCENATFRAIGLVKWNFMTLNRESVEEAKKRGLSCGLVVEAAEVCSLPVQAACSNESFLCSLATYTTTPGSQNPGTVKWKLTEFYKPYIMEAKIQGLDCGVGQIHSKSVKDLPLSKSVKDLPLCSKTGYFNNCFGSWISDAGYKFTGNYKSNSIRGVGTVLNLGNNKWKGDVQIGGRQNGEWAGQGVYIWHTGQARFEWDWDNGKPFNSNSTVNAVFPSLRRMFSNLPKSKRMTIQRSLAKKGLYTSSIDGAWGRNTLIGIARFTAEHLNSINLKASENVEIVLDAILEQSALARTKVAKPTIYGAVAKRDAAATKVASKTSSYKNNYTGQSLLYRKQIQFALKKLGFYSSSIDGLWGNGTSSAIVDYAQANGVGSKTPDSVFRSLLFKVNVPLSFDAPKPKSVPRSSNANGLKSITSNPSIAADQAYAVCLPLAQQAKSQASNQASRPSRSSSYDTNCRRDYFGNYDCTSRESNGGGGFWGGLADGMASSGAGRRAYNAVLSSCLAQYGWRKP